MKLFGWFRKDSDGVARARAAEVSAQQQLDQARAKLQDAERRVEHVRSQWPKTMESSRQTDRLLTRDSLTQRFWDQINAQGGRPT